MGIADWGLDCRLRSGLRIADWIEDCGWIGLWEQSSIQSIITTPIDNRQSNRQSSIQSSIANPIANRQSNRQSPIDGAIVSLQSAVAND
jgi:hypothetical protein